MTTLWITSFVSWLAFPAHAQSPLVVSGVVQERQGGPLATAEVRIRGVGGTVTSQSGEFAIALPVTLRIGDQIVLYVARKPQEWVIESPWEGITTVPGPSTTLNVFVLKRGDPRLLNDPAIIARLLTEYVTPKTTEATLSAGDYLKSVAERLGVSPDSLVAAFEKWVRNVQEPYQRGLAAMYERRYSLASELFNESIQASSSELGNKEFVLASAEYEQAHLVAALRAATEARRLLPNDPSVLNLLGVVLVGETRLEQAEDTLRLALRQGENVFSQDEQVAVLCNLVEVAVAREHPTDAAELIERLRGLVYRRPPDDYLARAMYIRARAMLLLAQDKLPEAAALLDTAIASLPQGPEGVVQAKSLVALSSDARAVALLRGGKIAQAESVYRSGLLGLAQTFGGEDPHVIVTEVRLAQVLILQGKTAEAESLFDRASTVVDRNWGPDNLFLADILNGQASILHQRGEFERSDSLLRRAVAIAERGYGMTDPRTANLEGNLGNLLYERGHYGQAEARFALAVATEKPISAMDTIEAFQNLVHYYQILRDEHRLGEAETMGHRALAMVEQDSMQSPEAILVTLTVLAECMREQNRIAEASVFGEHAQAIVDRYPRLVAEALPHILNEKARLLTLKGRHHEADSVFRRGLSILDSSGLPDTNVRVALLVGRGQLRDAERRFQDAEEFYREALGLAEADLGSEHPSIVRILAPYAGSLDSAGRPQDAESLYRRSIAITRKAWGPNHRNVAELDESLAHVLRRLGRLAEANALEHEAKDVKARQGP
jgi:tetratricopeptide (TPR) repeat protein